MKSGDAEILDMTRGQYRRQYAGYLRGRRINSVSLAAEAWFWRLNVTFDDFGNGDADPSLLHASTVGRRSGVSSDDVRLWVDELVTARLLERYTVGDDHYLHIVDFTTLQSAGKNGKRVRRFPAAGVSELIPVNPKEAGKSCAHNYQDQNHNQNIPAAQGVGGSSTTPPRPRRKVIAPPAEPENTPENPGESPAMDLPSGLQALWDAAPKVCRDRSARPKCLAVWRRLKLESRSGEVLSALRLWSASHPWTKQGGEYQLGLHRWLERRKFEELPESTARQRSDGSGRMLAAMQSAESKGAA